MKSTRSNNLIHIMSLTAMALLSALLLAGCYMAQETSPGAVSLNAVSSARSLMTYDGTDVWVVGVVIDSSFEAKLKELRAQEDYRKSTSGSVSEATKTLWKDMALKSAVRFEGGLPFFQFKMPRFNPDAVPYTNDFTIQGIPANKDYFLYLIVMANEVTSIDSFTDYGALLATSPVHYYDPDKVSGNFTCSGTGDVSFNSDNLLPAGWYSFTSWSPEYDGSGNLTYLTGEIWTDDLGKPISSQPFSVTPGESVTVPTLLVDY